MLLAFERNNLYFPAHTPDPAFHFSFYPDVLILVMEEGEVTPFSVLTEPEEKQRKGKGSEQKRGPLPEGSGLATICSQGHPSNAI